MNTKLKYTGIILGTLLIGFVIGFLTNGRLVKSRIDHMQSFYTEQGADRAFIRALNLTPEQMEEVRPILRKHAQQNHELLVNHRQHQQSLFQELENDLKPYLTEEQIQKMENLKHRWQERFPRKGGKGKQGKGSRHGRGDATPN